MIEPIRRVRSEKATLRPASIVHDGHPIEYQEYLRRVAELANRVEAGQSEDTPEELNTPGRRALYNNLDQDQDLALRIDGAFLKNRHDGWGGVQSREQVIKAII